MPNGRNGSLPTSTAYTVPPSTGAASSLTPGQRSSPAPLRTAGSRPELHHLAERAGLSCPHR
nr:hypothetical protein KPHV_84860 [Kitasatospora purpeofusca]